MSGAFAAHYRGKTVLVTGHTGFKGSWLCSWLTRLGARVVGFALPPEQTPSLFELAGIARSITHVEGDVRDLEALRQVVKAHRPAIVFHLAAQALVRRSFQTPVDTFATNVIGTAHVLEACRTAESVRSVIVVTSDKCYENREQLWPYREDDPMGGHDPYSASKGCAELVTSAYRRSFFAGAGVGLASARAGNVIGGGDWSEDRLVCDIVRAASAGKNVVIRNPRAIRPWQHVLEPLSGYLLLGARLGDDPGRFSSAWNFGPREEDPVPVSELAQRIVARLGRGALELAPADPSAPHEAGTLRLDSSRARQLLGWRPRLTLVQAVDMTAEWYRAALDDPTRAAPEVDRQITHYEHLAETSP